MMSASEQAWSSRIEPSEHAVYSGLDELSVIRSLHVIGADPLENVTEQVEVAIDF
jgi:hypothetical protein